MTGLAPMTAAARRAGVWLAAGVLFVYLATAGGSLTSVDAVMTYEVTRSLVSTGSTAFDRPGLNHHQGVDGRYYSPFGIGQSLFNVPFYVAARAADERLGLRVGRAETMEKAGVALGSTVAAAGAVWLVFLFAWRLSGNLDASVATSLACAFGTLLWPYSKFGFNQPLTAWCLTAGVYAAWLGVRLNRRGLLAWSGVWLSCAFLTRHEMALAAVLVAVWVAVESTGTPRRGAERLLWLAAPLGVALVFWIWYNNARFGHPFDTGNLGLADALDDQNFTVGRSTLVGMAGLLFSPGRALFLYVPLAVASALALPTLARRDRSLAWLIGGLAVSFLVLYGSLRFWDGLRGYGPRYLVPLLPLLMAPLVVWLGTGRRRRAVLLVAGLSALVQLPGVLVDYSKVSIDHARAVGDYSRDAKIYNWRESALVLDTHAALVAIPQNARNLVRGSRPAVAELPAEEADSSFAQRFSFSLDFWWLYLYYLSAVSAPVSIALGIAPLVLAAVFFGGVLRLRRSAPGATASGT